MNLVKISFIPFKKIVQKIQKQFKKHNLNIYKGNIDRMIHENFITSLNINQINGKWYVEKKAFKKFNVDEVFKDLYKEAKTINKENKTIINKFKKFQKENKKIPSEIQFDYESVTATGRFKSVTPSGTKERIIKLLPYNEFQKQTGFSPLEINKIINKKAIDIVHIDKKKYLVYDQIKKLI